ncbi:MAG: PAS domain S-box protein [Longimicrobiales bacterium]
MTGSHDDRVALLEAILDTSVTAVCVLDPDGQIVFANQKAADILGLKPHEIVKRRYDAPEWRSTAVDGGLWPDEKQPFVRVMETGAPVFDIQHAIEWPNGQRKIISVNGAPIKNAAGDIERLVFSIADVTERLEAERRARETDAWLRLALESSQMGIWSWEIATNEVLWSDSVAALFGVSLEDFGGTYQDYLERVHPDDLELVTSTVEEAVTPGRESYEIEHRLVRPNGEVRWLEARGRVFHTDAGEPTKASGTVVDVTTRKTAEVALRQSEAAFRSVLETVPSYILRVAPDHTIRFVNQTLPHLQMADVIGMNVVDFMAPESRETFLAALERAFQTGEAQEFEGLVLQPEPSHFLIRIGPVKSGEEVESVTVVGVDISQLKEAELALRDSQEQLLHAQRMESVGRLAGGMAHDFNNLLTVIMTSSSLAGQRLAQLPDQGALVRHIHRIRDASDRGAGLTQQLLAFARKQVVHPEVVDIKDLITKAQGLLAGVLGEDVELVTDLDSGLWPVTIDPGQFEQMLINLAVNARDAMPQGGLLRIEASNGGEPAVPADGEEGTGEWVCMMVTDTGCGMEAEMLSLVFEPFFTTKEAGLGTGLGLSTCFGIVRKAGGSITVESALGVGTTFRIDLPRSLEEPRAEEVPAEDQRFGGTETVLLVEDDDSVRQVTRDVLEGIGYSLLDASSGRGALELFGAQKEKVHLLITDVVMPGMGGAELADELLSRDPELKVLFLSGYSPDDGRLGDLVGRGIDLVRKPFSDAELSAKVRGVLGTDREAPRH